MSSREQMLSRIRVAVAKGAPSQSPPPVPRDYHRRGEHAPGSDQVVELVIDRLLDYKAEVTVVPRSGLAAAVDTALGSATSVVVPPGLTGDARTGCRSSGRTVVVDGDTSTLSSTDLDAIDAVVVGSTVAIAVTGTIVLSGRPDEGRRALSLVPDLLVVVLPVDRIVETVPDGLALLTPTAPLTMISGPSATSDIELSRVEGVHGPRTLRVVIVR